MTAETQAKVDAAAGKLADAVAAVYEAQAAWAADRDAGKATGHFLFPDLFPVTFNINHPYAADEQFRKLAAAGFISPGAVPGL